MVNYAVGEVVQEAGGESSVFGIIMNADGRLRITDSGGNEVKQIGQYEAFGINALDVTHTTSKDGDCTVEVSSEGPCTCVVVRRSPAMLQQMRGQQELARVSLFHAVEGHDSHVVGTCLAGNHDDPDSAVRMDELERVGILGKGSFGLVTMVHHASTNRYMALKAMVKEDLVETGQVENILEERNSCYLCRHEFIVRLHNTMQDQDQIYMLMELSRGGELWTLLYRKRTTLPRAPAGGWYPRTARFYLAGVVTAFQHVHDDISYCFRDLKPENVLLHDDGFPKLADFGFAKPVPYRNQRTGCLEHVTYTMCGTNEYLAPELVINKGHNRSCDFWSLGVLLYEFLMGVTPFNAKTEEKIFEKILHADKWLWFPREIPKRAVDLTMALLEPNPAKRMGYLSGKCQNIKDHVFFKELEEGKKDDWSWDDYESKKMPPPYIPKVKSPTDTSNFTLPPDWDEPVRPYRGYKRWDPYFQRW